MIAYKDYAPRCDYKMYGIEIEFTDFQKRWKTKHLGETDNKFMNQVTFDYDEVV